MKIYTRTGDEGETSLFGGSRVRKNALRIESFGTIDELNCVLGVCRSLNPGKKQGEILEQIQRDLFTLGAELATPPNRMKSSSPRITGHDVTRLERHIDTLETGLKPLRKFILPGGSPLGANLHLARTVCRRAERRVVELSGKERIGTIPLTYLNRLSDLLFVLARWENARGRVRETIWDY